MVSFKHASLISLGFLISSSVLAAGASSDSYEYPELNVTPKASERLETEAAREDARQWTTHLAVQSSALMTLVVGVTQLSNGPTGTSIDPPSGIVGLSVGGAWLGLTTVLAIYYRPYQGAIKSLNEMPKRTQRELLTRERFAEEAIHSEARLGAGFRWLSMLSNLGASAFMASSATKEGHAPVMGLVGAAAAFAPFLFPYRWERVAHEQAEYKKRIYAPIASGGFLPEPGTGKLAPGLTLSVLF